VAGSSPDRPIIVLQAKTQIDNHLYIYDPVVDVHLGAGDLLGYGLKLMNDMGKHPE